MFYDYSLTIPLNTLETSKVESDIFLTYGIIHRIEIAFPAGPRNMVYVAIRHGLHQLWPTNADGSFNSDNFTLIINEHYLMDRDPYKITLQGWSPDTVYQHVIHFRFGILPPAILMPEETFMQAFKKLLTRLRL